MKSATVYYNVYFKSKYAIINFNYLQYFKKLW